MSDDERTAISEKSDASSIASSVYDQYQIRTRAQRRQASQGADDPEKTKEVESEISSAQEEINELFQEIKNDNINIEEFEKELRKLYDAQGDDKATPEDFDNFLAELGVTGDDVQGVKNPANVPPPPPQPGSIKVPIYSDELIDAINNSNEQLNHDATKVELKEDGILVTVQNKPPAAQGGKSKKKQMKPKNKSNKKMKKKQTKKGGKQIKKRSLKHKMKK